MIHHQWSDTKPEFTEECILIVSSWHSHPKNQHWAYTLYEIKKLDSEDGWYWGICCDDGVEWGDLADLVANKYFTMPLLTYIQ